MKIGELAERTGLAASRIRFYESIGLLKTVKHPVFSITAKPLTPDGSYVHLCFFTCREILPPLIGDATFTFCELKNGHTVSAIQANNSKVIRVKRTQYTDACHQR